MKNIFTEHPHSVGETYFQHFRFACFFGINMLIGSFACFMHALFPFVFTKTGSDIIFKMTHKLAERKPSVVDEIGGLMNIMENKKQKS
jgi:hypothetical protein